MQEGYKKVRSTCHSCIPGCGIIGHIKNGKLVKIEGDLDHPNSRGTLCPKGVATPDMIYQPGRLKYPVKRVGYRGEGKWERISWAEALDTIANRLGEIKHNTGAESVVFSTGFHGIAGALDPYLGLFMHKFGSPNRVTNIHICATPVHWGNIYTCGFSTMAGLDFKNSNCIVMWGFDADVSWRGLCRLDIKEALSKGAKLIVVDPVKTGLASKADIWLQIRPGTDCALALSMLNVIINERLYDEQFVREWTFGFDRLKMHVQDYPPEKVEEITWVASAKIKEAARMYARNSPACIGSGAGGLTQNTNSVQTNRAIAMLIAITGNLDVPGGHIDYGVPLKKRATQACQSDAAYDILPGEQREKRLGTDRFALIKDTGLMIAHPTVVWQAILEGKPYPVKGWLAMGGNLITATENAKEVREALMNLEFFAISEYFMTPTAELADIVLPAAHWAERDEVIDAYTKNIVYAHRKLVEPPEECREDKLILIELARRLGIKYFSSVEESLDWRLEAIGITFDQLREKGMIEVPVRYKKHEQYGGFRTGSKKIDLYSESLESLGYEPMPVHHEPPESPVSTPELAKEYPLILITGRKILSYFHGMFRNIPRLQKLAPEPLAEIHPDTANSLGIKDGDWVRIETPRGAIKHKAKIFGGINPKVVATSHGWWYGYENGWEEVNINILTDNRHLDPHIGSSPLKGLLCKVTRIEQEAAGMN